MDSSPGQRRANLLAHFDLFTRGHDEPDLKAEWLTLFADDCYTEEPVGTVRRYGIQSTGWDMTHSDNRRLWLHPVVVIASEATNEAVSAVHERLIVDGSESEFTAIGVWEFSDNGLIQGSRIFVNTATLGPDAWAAVQTRH